MVTVHYWKKNKRVAIATQSVEKAKRIRAYLSKKYFGRPDVSSNGKMDINLFYFADQWATYID